MKQAIYSLSMTCISMSISGTALAADPETCRVLKIADGGYSDNTAQNGLAAAIIEPLGYETDITLLSVPITLQSLANGQQDVFFDAWSPAIDPLTKPYIDKGEIVSIKTMFTDAKYTLAVPAYAYDAGLRDFGDIHKFKDQLDGKLYGLEAGNDSNISIAKMIETNDFNLSSFELVESSEQAVLAQLRRLQTEKKWMVFPAWSPHPMNIEFDIRYLSGGDKYYGANYGAASVYAVARVGLLEDCPNMGHLLKNITFTSSMESEVMATIASGTDFKEAGRQYIIKHPKLVDTWLDGVTTFSGEPSLPVVKSALGMPVQ